MYLRYSNRKSGGYALAQQLRVREGDNEVNVFMKGALTIRDLSTLKRVKNALEDVIEIES